MSMIKNLFSALKQNVFILAISVLEIALVIMVLVDNKCTELITLVATVAITLFSYVIYLRAHKSTYNQSVLKKLKKAGLKCKEKDGFIIVKQDEIVLRAQLWNRPEKGSKRVHFSLEFAPNVINQVKEEGWAILAAQCNANFTYTTIKYLGDHFCCQVETTVKSANDFVREYQFAYSKICETLAGLEQNTPEIVKHFEKKETHQIGFRIPSSENSDEDGTGQVESESAMAA